MEKTIYIKITSKHKRDKNMDNRLLILSKWLVNRYMGKFADITIGWVEDDFIKGDYRVRFKIK